MTSPREHFNSFDRSLFYGNIAQLNKEIVASVAYAARKYFLESLKGPCLAFIHNLLPNDIPGFISVQNELYTYGMECEHLELWRRAAYGTNHTHRDLIFFENTPIGATHFFCTVPLA